MVSGVLWGFFGWFGFFLREGSGQGGRGKAGAVLV